MTNDELLAGFLDRSLNEDQLLEFEARKQADPGFAQEVNEMLTVEGLLKTSAPRGLAPAGFLVGVEGAVAYKLFSSSPAASAVGGWFSSAWTWVAAVGVTLIGAATFFVVNRPSSDVQVRPTSDVQRPTSVVQRPTSITEPQTTNQQPQTTVIQRPASGVQRPASDVQQRVASNEQRATSYEVETSYESTIAKLKKDLDACRASNDHVRCTQIALQIGRTYRERRLMDEAMNYLTMAQLEARQAHIIQYEIDAYGEIGLLMRDAGRTVDANENFKIAVDLGTKNGIDVQRWTSEIR